jgi:hypothetical protein
MTRSDVTTVSQLCPESFLLTEAGFLSGPIFSGSRLDALKVNYFKVVPQFCAWNAGTCFAARTSEGQRADGNIVWKLWQFRGSLAIQSGAVCAVTYGAIESV